MFKKELGISVYPEKCDEKELDQYLEKCYNAGIKKIFISLLQIRDLETVELYKKAIKKIKNYGFYIVADIFEWTEKLFGTDYLKILSDLKVDCLRLDSPLMAKEVADWTFNDYNFDVQVNASNNDNFITNIFDFKPRKEKLFACHNFFPQIRSALPMSFFEESSARFVKLGVHTSAFVGSKNGTVGPQQYPVPPLVTVEDTRFLPIRSQAKLLFATDLVDSIYVGNYPMSDEEIKSFSDVVNLKKIELDIKLNYELNETELKILNYNNHFRRGDISEDFVRSTRMRIDFYHTPIEPKNTKSILKKGDVCIVNKNNPNYNSELIIILKDNYELMEDKVNVIGTVADYDLQLLNYIHGWSRFEFRIV